MKGWRTTVSLYFEYGKHLAVSNFIADNRSLMCTFLPADQVLMWLSQRWLHGKSGSLQAHFLWATLLSARSI